MSSTDPKAKIEDVTVHFFAVKEEQAGVQVRKLDKGVVAEAPLSWTSAPATKTRAN